MSNQDNSPMTINEHGAKRGMKSSVIFLTLMLGILLGAVGFAYWYGYQQIRASTFQLASTQDNLSSLQQSVAELRQATEKALSLSAEQEQMIKEWKAAQKGDLNKWYVAEAQYLVKLANDHMQFTHNTSMALTLLQRADQVLQNLQDTSVLEIRKSLAEKISALQQLPKVDITGLYLELVALNKQLDQLPLPASPLKADKQAVPPPVENATATWWQKGLDQTWQALQKIVIVRNNMNDVRPLILPEEKVFLYQNLHAAIEDAMWGALRQNMNVYHASLERATAWIKLYFDQDAPATQNMLQNLIKLQEVNIDPPVVSLASTLQIFDHYFASAGTV